MPLVKAVTADHGDSGRFALAIALAYVTLATLYSVTVPVFEAPDEPWHYRLAQHLADGGGLPVQNPARPGPWLQEGSQPPLYYLLGAVVLAPIEVGNIESQMRRNPHAAVGVIQPRNNINVYVHYASEGWPWRQVPLAVHVLRLLSIALGAGAVLGVYRLGLGLLPGRPWIALSATALVAFNPQFVFITASVNNDAAVTCFSTWALVAATASVRRSASLAHGVWLGALSGAAALSKVSGLGLLPLGLLAVWLGRGRSRGAHTEGRARAWPNTGRHVPVAAMLGHLVAAGLIAGWWYWRNLRLYGDTLGTGPLLDMMGRRQLGLAQLLGELDGLRRSFWAVFGWFNVLAPERVHVFYAALGLLALLGWLLAAGRRWRGGSAWGGVALDQAAAESLMLLALWSLMVLLALIRWTTMTSGTQGRLLFPAIGAMAVLGALGLWNAVALLTGPGATAGWRFAALLAASLGLIAAAILPAVIGPAYAAAPTATPQDMGTTSLRSAQFGRAGDALLELVGYGVAVARPVDTPLAATDEPRQLRASPGQRIWLTLYWRALRRPDRDYSMFIHLVPATPRLGPDRILAQVDSYPAGGNSPTSQWTPGPVLRAEHSLVIPERASAGDPPSRLALVAGLYEEWSGQRLWHLNRSGQPAGDYVILGFVDTTGSAEPQPTSLREGKARQPLCHNRVDRLADMGRSLRHRPVSRDRVPILSIPAPTEECSICISLIARTRWLSPQVSWPWLVWLWV